MRGAAISLSLFPIQDSDFKLLASLWGNVKTLDSHGVSKTHMPVSWKVMSVQKYLKPAFLIMVTMGNYCGCKKTSGPMQNRKRISDLTSINTCYYTSMSLQ